MLLPVQINTGNSKIQRKDPKTNILSPAFIQKVYENHFLDFASWLFQVICVLLFTLITFSNLLKTSNSEWKVPENFPLLLHVQIAGKVKNENCFEAEYVWSSMVFLTYLGKESLSVSRTETSKWIKEVVSKEWNCCVEYLLWLVGGLLQRNFVFQNM